MSTTTTDQAIANAMLEKWSFTLRQYVSAIGIVVVLYDYFLTIPDEVCLTLLRLGAVSSVCSLFADTPCLARRPEFPKKLVLL